MPAAHKKRKASVAPSGYDSDGTESGKGAGSSAKPFDGGEKIGLGTGPGDVNEPGITQSESRRRARVLRNRASAQRSRDAKKNHQSALEDRVKELEILLARAAMGAAAHSASSASPSPLSAPLPADLALAPPPPPTPQATATAASAAWLQRRRELEMENAELRGRVGKLEELVRGLVGVMSRSSEAAVAPDHDVEMGPVASTSANTHPTNLVSYDPIGFNSPVKMEAEEPSVWDSYIGGDVNGDTGAGLNQTLTTAASSPASFQTISFSPASTAVSPSFDYTSSSCESTNAMASSSRSPYATLALPLSPASQSDSDFPSFGPLSPSPLDFSTYLHSSPSSPSATSFPLLLQHPTPTTTDDSRPALFGNGTTRDHLPSARWLPPPQRVASSLLLHRTASANSIRQAAFAATSSSNNNTSSSSTSGIVNSASSSSKRPLTPLSGSKGKTKTPAQAAAEDRLRASRSGLGRGSRWLTRAMQQGQASQTLPLTRPVLCSWTGSGSSQTMVMA